MSDLATFVKREKARVLEELFDFLRFPSVSTDPDRDGDCRNAAVWLADHLKALGFRNVKLLADEYHPVVWAESRQLSDKPTVLVYGHYDVQPPDPLDLWRSEPFNPTVRNGNIYARGVSDDKGQVFAIVKALEAVMRDGVAPVNVRLLIEGQEETGSEVIAQLLEQEPERTEADVALVSDMPYFAPGYPAVYSSLRGICYAELRVRTLDGDLHSGMYGGLAPNAHETLVRMLHKLKAENGRIRIPGLYDSVARPPKAQRELWAKLPSSDTGLRREMGSRALTGIQTHPPLERLWALPTFEIHGISGGFTGQGAKTVIPAEATAKISLRLVPNQKEREVRRLLKRAVKVVTPSYAKSELTFVHGGDPVLVDTDRPAFDSLNAAYEEVEGRTAVEIRSGGSIPIVPALAKRGAAVVLTGIGLPDDAFHAPNEKLSVDQFLKGIRIYGSFLRRLGA